MGVTTEVGVTTAMSIGTGTVIAMGVETTIKVAGTTTTTIEMLDVCIGGAGSCRIGV